MTDAAMNKRALSEHADRLFESLKAERTARESAERDLASEREAHAYEVGRGNTLLRERDEARSKNETAAAEYVRACRDRDSYAEQGEEARCVLREAQARVLACLKQHDVLDAMDRVRDVLDPWVEGPPAESGWYEVEGEMPHSGSPSYFLYAVGDGTYRDAENNETYDYWPNVSGRPARHRPLRPGTPGERT